MSMPGARAAAASHKPLGFPPGRFKATLFCGVRCCLISEWGCSIRVGVAQTPVEQSMKSRKFAKKIPEFYILLYGLTVIYL